MALVLPYPQVNLRKPCFYFLGDRRCDNDPKTDGCYSLPLPPHSGSTRPEPEVLYYFSIASGTCRAFHLKLDGEQCGREAYFTDGQECLRECAKSSPTEEDLPSKLEINLTVGGIGGTRTQARWGSKRHYLLTVSQNMRLGFGGAAN